MAIEKPMNSRVLLKNDIEANWMKAVNFIPRLGEVIIYNAETENDNTQLPKDPSTGQNLRDYWITYPRIKIGDNKQTNVNDLPFITDEIWKYMAQVQKFWAEDDNAGSVEFKASTLIPTNQEV